MTIFDSLRTKRKSPLIHLKSRRNFFNHVIPLETISSSSAARIALWKGKPGGLPEATKMKLTAKEELPTTWKRSHFELNGNAFTDKGQERGEQELHWRNGDIQPTLQNVIVGQRNSLWNTFSNAPCWKNDVL